MADQNLDNFLAGLQNSLVSAAQTQAVVTKRDDKLDYFKTPSPNAIEWAVRSEFGNIPTFYDHTRQYQIMRDFFQLRCPLPSCNDQTAEAKDCWGKGKEYLQSENLLVWNKKYNEDVCPCCNSTRSELLSDKLIKIYNQLHAVVGMRGGKSSLAATMGTYIEHRVICLGHSHPNGIAGYFGQLPNQPFEMTFVASNEVQSADTIWAKFTGIRQNSPWIQDYIRWLKDKELQQPTRSGTKPWQYVEHGKDIVNGLLNVKINSMNSNSSGMAGRTRLASFIDELARFDNTDSKNSSDEAYRVLENSLRTLRTPSLKTKEVPWLGTMISISSPISEDDKSMRLLRDAPRINGMYHCHYATWDFNPMFTRKDFDDDFEKDPIGAQRDFGANPPTSASPLIQDPTRFKELAIQKDLLPTANFRKIIHTDRTNREYVSAIVDNAQLLRNGERYICFDAGSTFDQFAGACAHGEWIHVPEGRQLVTVFDWVYRILPEQKPRRDVWFDFVMNAIEHLSKYYSIARIEFDRWQSNYLIQKIRDRGIMCESQGTKPDQFIKLVNDVSYSRVRMLPPQPDDYKMNPPDMSAAGLAFYELEHLEITPDFKKVFNAKKGQRRGWNSDDVATVVAHANHMVQSSVVDVSNSNSPEARLRRETAGGHNYQSEGGGGSLYRPGATGMSRRMW